MKYPHHTIKAFHNIFEVRYNIKFPARYIYVIFVCVTDEFNSEKIKSA